MSSRCSDESVALYGWTAVARDPKILLLGNPYIHKPNALLINDIEFPSDDRLVAKIQEYVKAKFARSTFHHSMRVFYYGKPTFSSCYSYPASSPHPL